jgi:hypothetical protein
VDPAADAQRRPGPGGNGALRNNFELFVRVGTNLEHWYRENADPNRPWVRVRVVRSDDQWRDTFHDDALDCPAAVQSTFNRNYELVYRTSYRYLRHVYYDQTSGWWNDATIFGPIDPVGVPGFIQSNRGAPGDFEVVIVTQSGQAEHWTKHNSAPWTHQPGEWYLRERFGTGFSHGGASLVQSLWVPVIRSPHATCAYSWISPPSRSRRTTLPAGTATADSTDPSGGAWPKARCGR